MNHPAQALADALLSQLGPDIVTVGDPLQGQRWADWSGVEAAVPRALIRPRDTGQVARALELCHAHRQSVVVQGGLTGLAGAACTQEGDVAMRLDRMNRILELDAVSGTITVEAGATLQQVQEAAAAAGFMFPLDLGARGSCTIGGNLACNAGGNRVIKYGMMRDQVLGLEAVMADGSVIGALHKMIKNNTGFDLKNLLIGSEGTLGVITRAVLRLRPPATTTSTAWCGLRDFDAATRLLREAQARLSGGVSAFEVMWPSYYDYVLARVPRQRRPLAQPHGLHVLIENMDARGEEAAHAFAEFLEAMLDEGVIDDAAVAHSQADVQALWAIRDAPSEFPALMPGYIGFDISFAIADIGCAAQECEAMLRTRWPDCTALVYGHLGDGNLHVIVHVPDANPAVGDEIERMVYELVRCYHGAVSAEHGIGLRKRSVLGHSRSAADIAAMGAIKDALDPRRILNPHKVFSLN